MTAQDLEDLLKEEPYLRSLARSLIAGDEDDLVQQTYLQAMQEGDKVIRSPRSWLARILRNLASNLHRGRARSQAREAQVARYDLVPSSAELLEREEQRRALVAAVDSLDEMHRSILLLRYFEGLPPRRIASQLDLPVEMVWNRLRRGLELMRQKLDAQHGGDRRAWALPLLPLIVSGPEPLPLAAEPLLHASPSLSIPGVMLMSTKLRVAAAAVVLLAMAGGTVWALQGDEVGAGSMPEIDPAAVAIGDSEQAEADLADRAGEGVNREALSKVASVDASELGSLRLVVAHADDNAPAAEVGFELQRVGRRGPLATRLFTRTNAAGVALLENMHPGGYNLFPDLKTRHRLIEIFAGEETEVIMELAQGVRVTGSVIDSKNQPVPGARIYLGAYAMLGDMEREVARSDANGQFEIRGASEYGVVSARAEGFAASHGHMLNSAAGQEVELSLRMDEAGGQVHGRVIDSEGDPVRGARLRLGKDGFDLATIMLPGGVKGFRRRPIELYSDDEGRFEARGLPPGNLAINLRAKDKAPWSGSSLVVSGEGTELLIEVQDGRELSGKISDPTGSPGSRVEVEVGEGGKLAYYQTWTEADGRYRLTGLPREEFTVRAGDEERGRAEKTFAAGSAEELIWDAQLNHGDKILGKVIDRDGKPVPRAYVSASLSDDESGPNPWYQSGHAAEDGSFSLRDCPAGKNIRVAVEVRGRRLAVRDPVDPRKGELVIQIEDDIVPSVRVRGRVVDSEGAALANAELLIERGMHNADADGAFDLGPYMPGEIQLRIHPKGKPQFQSETRELFANETWDLGVIQIPAGGTLMARLQGIGGEQDLRPTIQVQPLDGSQRYMNYSAAEVHSQILAPGSYRLAIRGQRVANQAIPFEIKVGETSEVEAYLQPGLQREFEFSGENGAGLEGHVDLSITGPEGLVYQGPVRDWRRNQGRPEASASFAPGEYRLEAASAAGLIASMQFTVEAGQESADKILVTLR